MKAELITIGDEILIGQIVDTNSAWMAVELNQLGIEVGQITSISDQDEQLVHTLDEALQRADVLLLTGGLGPTRDDRTKKVLCDYFDSRLVLHEATLEHINDLFFKKRGIPVNQMNRDQALVPECCTVLMNKMGTAPGMWFEKEGKIIVSMPGVPYEMKYLMTHEVLPRLAKVSGRGKIFHKTVLTTGLSESYLAEQLSAWEDQLPAHIHLAYLPDPGRVRLRLSAFGHDEQTLEKEVWAEIEQIKQIIPDAIFGYDQDSLAGVVGHLLKMRGASLCTAESCTGGYLAHLLTSEVGSSAWYKGSVVAYANEVKTNVLGVDPKMIAEHGAVSQQVVEQMATNVRTLLNCDYALASSGIAGPDGGTPEKPVGSVWIALASPEQTISKWFTFTNNRERNIIRSAQTALDMLRLVLLNTP
ncbi:MAG: competence/damage-inducible protein A [Prolixibacteraceae bacterium]|nr:competence/damage-inducible protein A [Prolixibacteraceae bacterium]